MAAIRTNPLYLWLKGQPAGSNRTLGSIFIKSLDQPWNSADGGLRLGIEYRPPEVAGAEGRLVNLAATILSTWPTRRPHGRVQPLADPAEQKGVLGNHAVNVWWLWHVAPDEIEAIERDRAPNAGAETLSFNLELNGVASIDAETWGFGGETQFSLATSDWLGLLRSLGYGTPVSLQNLAGQSLIAAPSWAWAQEKIQAARRHLALGEDREALRTAYVLFDAVARNPYRAKWDEILADSDMPTEKAEIIRAFLNAHATTLNKLGRHPSDDLTDGRDRRMLPLDHWEAELAVGISQLLLAAVERWRTIREVHEHDRPLPTAGEEAS